VVDCQQTIKCRIEVIHSFDICSIVTHLKFIADL
jgi:hypothetical protein